MPSLDTLMSYHRLKKAPLDDSEIFNNLSDLMDYCNNGACYDGQRVAVLNENLAGVGAIEYVIKNNIPIIDMKGSEPIFIDGIIFKNDATYSKAMLIYEFIEGSNFSSNDVFCLDYDKYCIISQLEIFRILDATGNKTFKFYLERHDKEKNTSLVRYWIQNYNPFTDGFSNPITQSPNGNISKMSFIPNDLNNFLKTEDSNISLMPSNNNDSGIITRIYVKAEDYYQAWKN